MNQSNAKSNYSNPIYLMETSPKVQSTTPAQPQVELKIDWENWLREYSPKLLLFARGQSRSTEDAQDIFQSALIKLHKKVSEKTFKGEEKATLSYMYTQIRREAIDLGRKNGRRQKRENFSQIELDINHQQDSHGWEENTAMPEETLQLLQTMLTELPEKFAQVIHMKIWGELTFLEISKDLKLSQNTVASRYRYGMQSLKKRLDYLNQQGKLELS